MMLMKSFSSPRSSMLLTHSPERSQQSALRTSLRSPHSGSHLRAPQLQLQPRQVPPNTPVGPCPAAEPSAHSTATGRTGANAMHVECEHCSVAHNVEDAAHFEREERVVMRKPKSSSASAIEASTVAGNHKPVRSRVKSELVTSPTGKGAAQRESHISNLYKRDSETTSPHKRAGTKSEPPIPAESVPLDSSGHSAASKLLDRHEPLSRRPVTPSVFRSPVDDIRYIGDEGQSPTSESPSSRPTNSRVSFSSTALEWNDRKSHSSRHVCDAQTQTIRCLQESSTQTLSNPSSSTNEVTSTSELNRSHNNSEETATQRTKLRKPALKLGNKISPNPPLHVQISISTDDHSSVKSTSPTNSPTGMFPIHAFVHFKEHFKKGKASGTSTLSGSSSSVCSETVPSTSSSPSPTICASASNSPLPPIRVQDTREEILTLREDNTLVYSNSDDTTREDERSSSPLEPDALILQPESSSSQKSDSDYCEFEQRKRQSPPMQQPLGLSNSPDSKRLAPVIESSNEQEDDNDNAEHSEISQLEGE